MKEGIFHSYDFLGSFLGDNECTFRVWAPNAKEVYVTGISVNGDQRITGWSVLIEWDL